VIDSKLVDHALAFLIEHLPPSMHLVIATREDPDLPLARLRAGGQLAELRVVDLRFVPAEAAEFLNRVMGLNLSTEDIDALDTVKGHNRRIYDKLQVQRRTEAVARARELGLL